MSTDEQRLPDTPCSEDLPLLELFTRLRQAGLPLGMTEYHLVLEALRSGFGLPDEAALARLCRTLWTKSEEDQLLFNYHFEQVMAENAASFAVEKVPLFPSEESSAENAPVPVDFVAKTWRRIPVWARWGLGGALATVFGTNLWLARPKCPYFTSSPTEVITEYEQYDYVITACKANPGDELEITVLDQHPWLNFDPNPAGYENEPEETALLSTNVAGDVEYSQAELWDFQGTRIASLGADVNEITSIQFSDNGQRLLTTHSSAGAARLWNLQGRQLTEVNHLAGPSRISLSADGQRILSFNEDGTARLFDAEGEVVSDFGKRTNIREIRFSASTQLILSRTGEGSVRLWDLDGTQLLELNNLGILQAELTSDEESLITLSNTGKVQRWDLDGERLGAFSAQSAKSMQMSPTGEHVLIASDDGFRIWDLQGQFVSYLKKSYNRTTVFSPDGQKVLVRALRESDRDSGSDSVVLWDFRKNRVTSLDSIPRYTRFSLDGQYILLGDRAEGDYVPESFRLWDLESQQKVTDFDLNERVAGIRFSPKGQYLIAQLYDYDDISQPHILGQAGPVKMQIWDLEGNEVFPLLRTQKAVVSADEQLLATIAWKSEVKLQVTDLASNISDIQTFNLVSAFNMDVLNQKLGESLAKMGAIGAFLIMLVLPSGYLVTRWLLGRMAKPTEFPPLPELDSEASTSAANLNQGLADEVQVAQAINQGSTRNSELLLNSFTQTSEYFPITSRQMKQSWRYLRRLIREGPLVELDVDATVRQVSREGMLLQPLLRARRVNRNELLLLVDQDGSMVPFHSLSQRLASTAINGGRLSKTGIYYFHNCPSDCVYHDPYLQDAVPVSDVLAQVHAEYTGVLIFSDAGAARGAFNRQRLMLTQAFLAQMQGQLKYVAWINPMPRDRWTGTAAEIARHIPMFELSRQGLNQAIDVLRGKPVGASGFSDTASSDAADSTLPTLETVSIG
ncbi:MAG: hypothetical protein AAFQ95_14245 [Cyanobacteria bacterium J06621_3]